MVTKVFINAAQPRPGHAIKGCLSADHCLLRMAMPTIAMATKPTPKPMKSPTFKEPMAQPMPMPMKRHPPNNSCC